MRIDVLLSAMTTCFGVASATHTMKAPWDFKAIWKKPNTIFHYFPWRPFPPCDYKRGGKVNAAYFTSWSIYARQFTPQNIDISTLTHIYYAFADTNITTGEIFLTDSWADTDKTYPGEDSTAPGHNLYGNLHQLYLLKQKKRTLKTVLALGGWTAGQAGHWNFTTNPTARTTFAKSAAKMVEDLGMDGISIDWEYPTDDQAAAFVLLLKETRAALNDLAKRKGDRIPYELNAAGPAGSQNYEKWHVGEMAKYLTYFSITNYDYGGSWSTVAEPLDNVFGGVSGVSTEATTKWYVENGVPRDMILIGSPVYSADFENTDGIYKPFDGTGPGTWEAGHSDYKALPLPGAKVYNNFTEISSYSYDPVKRELKAYDTPEIVRAKTKWLLSRGFRGLAFWELSADKNGTDSLVWNGAQILKTLDATPNHLRYPFSQYDNIKNANKYVKQDENF